MYDFIYICPDCKSPVVKPEACECQTKGRYVECSVCENDVLRGCAYYCDDCGELVCKSCMIDGLCQACNEKRLLWVAA